MEKEDDYWPWRILSTFQCKLGPFPWFPNGIQKNCWAPLFWGVVSDPSNEFQKFLKIFVQWKQCMHPFKVACIMSTLFKNCMLVIIMCEISKWWHKDETYLFIIRIVSETFYYQFHSYFNYPVAWFISQYWFLLNFYHIFSIN